MDINELEEFIYSRLEDEFTKKLFKATILQLEYDENPIKYNSFAFSFRELVRHIFYNLAPDAEVKNCIWYEDNKDVASGITRRHRMEYAIRGGLSNDFLKDELGINLKELTKKTLDSINVLSKYTHIQEEVFSVEESKGDKIVKDSMLSLVKFFEEIDYLKDNLIDKYEHLLFDIIDEIFTNETFDEIDMLSTHHLVDEIVLDEVEILDINSCEIYVEIVGIVSVQHMYGSDRDRRKGEGDEFNSSYPFKVSKIIEVLYPLDISIDPSEVIIDNSKFFE